MQINNNFSTTTPSYRNNFQTTQTTSTLNFSDNLVTTTTAYKIPTVSTADKYYNETIDKLFGEISGSIDWNADGTSTLTEQQIEELKSKYNINNLSDDDYYNLIADLTNMNVLSMEDVNNVYTSNLPENSCIFRPMTEAEINAIANSNSTTVVDILESRYEALGEEINSYGSPLFWLSNSSTDYKELVEYTQKEMERLESFDKVLSVINSLK